MEKWLLVMFLGLQAHFAASYLVPLDAQSQKEFGGLLRWFWPWAYGDGGLLGQITPAAGFPVAGFYIAATAAALFIFAALAAGGFWVPVAWLRPLAGVGSVVLLALMAVFFGPTKLIPIAFALGTLYLVMVRPSVFAAAE